MLNLSRTGNAHLLCVCESTLFVCCWPKFDKPKTVGIIFKASLRRGLFLFSSNMLGLEWRTHYPTALCR